MGFIADLIYHTKDQESPLSFWKWGAYTTIGAILRDNVWKPDGDTQIYANVYTLLLADSGYARKGRPVNLCTKLIRDTNNTTLISGRTSIQALTDDLAHTKTDPVTGILCKAGSAIFTAPELEASLVADTASIGILTDIYDFRDEYPISLRGRGKTTIKKMVFSLFGASNEALLRNIFNMSAIQGGLLARTFLVVPDEFRKANSMLDFADTSVSYKQLVCRLKDIAKLKGAIQMTDQGKIAYEEWYTPFRNGQKNKSDKSGIVSRIHTHVLKLAMILAADAGTIIVDQYHIQEAIEECISLIPNYNIFVMATGKSSIAEVGAILLPEMLGKEGFCMSRKEILTKYWTTFDADTLEKLVAHLEGAGMLTSEHDRAVGIRYKLTEKCVEIMKGK